MHLGVVGGEDDQAVTLFDDLVDGHAALQPQILAPLLGGAAALGGVNMAVGVNGGGFPAGSLADELRVVVGVPLVEVIINETDFDDFGHKHSSCRIRFR